MSSRYLEEQERLTRKHRLNPEAGDYWSDHFTPMMLVLAATDTHVTLVRDRVMLPHNHWDWDYDKVQVTTREDFAKIPLYNKDCEGPLGDKCFCQVSPGKMMQDVIEWRNNPRPKKILLDNAHISQRFLEVV
jgi:hypothetical protein